MSSFLYRSTRLVLQNTLRPHNFTTLPIQTRSRVVWWWRFNVVFERQSVEILAGVIYVLRIFVFFSKYVAKNPDIMHPSKSLPHFLSHPMLYEYNGCSSNLKFKTSLLHSPYDKSFLASWTILIDFIYVRYLLLIKVGSLHIDLFWAIFLYIIGTHKTKGIILLEVTTYSLIWGFGEIYCLHL
jgi:hypothetical protein